jgi:hypothetical protein
MRRTKEITINRPDEVPEYRDHGRRYLVTEMPSPKAEKWFQRAVNGLATAGVNLQGIEPGMGALAFTVISIDAVFRMPWNLAEPLIDEMFECVQFVMESGQPRKLLPDDIEEVATRILLRGEVADLHLGFSLVEKLLELRDQLLATSQAIDTETSPTPSDS